MNACLHEYDVVLKLLLKGAARKLMRALTDTPVSRWLDVEMSEVVHNTRVDLLGECAGGELIHLELQSTNDPTMALRMAEYSLLSIEGLVDFRGKSCSMLVPRDSK